MTHVLLVEDDPVVAEIICGYLHDLEEYKVTVAGDAETALALCNLSVDIILMDIMLPDLDGVSLCEKIREKLVCPILFVSCIDDSNTIIHALEKGGDDYIVKPFEPQILHARIQANLRRVRIDQGQIQAQRLSAGRYSIDPDAKKLNTGIHQYSLSNMELRILSFFMEHPNQYFTSAELYRKIWGKPSYGDTRTVLVHIHNLRNKLEDDPSRPQALRSVPGKGYVFSLED